MSVSPHPDFITRFEAAKPALRAFIASVVQDAGAREDILQSTALTLWEQYGRYDTGRSFGAWARGVAAHKIIHDRRRLAREIRGFPMIAVGSVLTESQWESLRPALTASPDSLLAEFSVPVISDQWTDLGDRAPDVLRWATQSLGLHGVLGADELTFNLLIGSRFLGADPASKPASTTSITVWTGHFLLLGYADPAAALESQKRGLVIRVQPLE